MGKRMFKMCIFIRSIFMTLDQDSEPNVDLGFPACTGSTDRFSTSELCNIKAQDIKCFTFIYCIYFLKIHKKIYTTTNAN